MAERKPIRVFISSPSDCQTERDAVEATLDQMNKAECPREGVFFETVRSEDLAPATGKNPQSVIDDQVGNYDILVGIMWMKFGTPIPGGAGSGTEHEVKKAVADFQKIGSPRVMFYFKDEPPKDNVSKIDPKQLEKVQDFQKRLGKKGLYQTFRGTDDFTSKLRLHLNKVLTIFREGGAAGQTTKQSASDTPYQGFLKSFREVVAARRIAESGGCLDIVFGNIADVREMPVVIPVGQAFDFNMRGPRSVLAAFESIRIGSSSFYDYIESSWPATERPTAAGLGHTKYIQLPGNSQALPGVMFVVTTRDLSTKHSDRGYFVNTPIEGIDLTLESVVNEANRLRLSSIALPLLGAGYANVQRTYNRPMLARLLTQVVALITIRKLDSALRGKTSSLRRAVIVIYSRQPNGEEEHDIWEKVTRFLASRAEQQKEQIDDMIRAISAL